LAAYAVLGALLLVACGGSEGRSSTPSPGAATHTPGAASSSPAKDASPAAPSPVQSQTHAPPAAGAYQAVRAFPNVAFAEMTGMFAVPGDPAHALVLTKPGIIYRVDVSRSDAQPAVFMDIRDRIIRNPGPEEGLLGLAFAPDYVTSRRFYVYYSAGNPRRTRVSRFAASGDHADPASEHVILEIEQPFSNHKGGQLAFGPDGDLYIGVGDGGSEGDPSGNGQNVNTLLGKILRIDVSGDAHAIPADNPFSSGGGKPEIYAWGLRNPWRFSFDPATGALWVGDVGQDKWEEVDRVEKGKNYGWSIMEATHCYKPSRGCDERGLGLPRAEYSHAEGCSITGGFVYHGAAMPELDGSYLYSDYCSGRVWALNTADASPPVELANTGKPVVSFMQGADGEAYLVTFAKAIYRLAPN
jgi:glucose/arabinose dehydrogenase